MADFPTEDDIEALARRLWDEQGKQFRSELRVTYENGSEQAKALIRDTARQLLTAKLGWELPEPPVDLRLRSDYPSDYGKYLDECYDVAIGNVKISYEEWKAKS